MTTTHSHTSHRRLNVSSLVLLLIGLVFGALAYWLVNSRDANPILLVPAVVAATIGATHIAKREVRRD